MGSRSQRTSAVTSRAVPSDHVAIAESWLVSPIALKDLRPLTVSAEGGRWPEGTVVGAKGWLGELFEPPQPGRVTAMMTQIRIDSRIVGVEEEGDG